MGCAVAFECFGMTPSFLSSIESSLGLGAGSGHGVFHPSLVGQTVCVSATSKGFRRAARRRCPRCGYRELFASYFKIKDPCPSCGLKLERGDSEGHFLGAVMINLVCTEIVFGLVLLVGVFVTWPHPHWGWILGFGVAANVTFPILFYPYSLTLWTAIDLMLFRLDEWSLPKTTYTRDVEVPED
jgi:uncharacterized protein (DUF983 family)